MVKYATGPDLSLPVVTADGIGIHKEWFIVMVEKYK